MHKWKVVDLLVHPTAFGSPFGEHYYLQPKCGVEPNVRYTIGTIEYFFDAVNGVYTGTYRKPSTDPSNFIARAASLESLGSYDAALDLIYDSVDRLLREAQFALCASLLAEVAVSKCSVDVLLGMLVATLPARTRISTRAAFLNRVRSELLRRDEDVDSLLRGLE